MKSMRINRFLLALALAAAAPFAAAAFQSGMTVEQAEAEVKVQRAAGATLAQIIQNAQKAPLNAGLITTALINGTDFSVAEIVEAMLRAGAPLQAVVDAALAAGATPQDVTLGALAANVQLAVVIAAIAASPTASRAVVPAAGGSSAGAGGSVSPS
jgi:hypothetical protein